jgi:hypothetical protein
MLRGDHYIYSCGSYEDIIGMNTSLVFNMKCFKAGSKLFKVALRVSYHMSRVPCPMSHCDVIGMDG